MLSTDMILEKYSHLLTQTNFSVYNEYITIVSDDCCNSEKVVYVGKCVNTATEVADKVCGLLLQEGHLSKYSIQVYRKKKLTGIGYRDYTNGIGEPKFLNFIGNHQEESPPDDEPEEDLPFPSNIFDDENPSYPKMSEDEWWDWYENHRGAWQG
jgi:hypothetical protein